MRLFLREGERAKRHERGAFVADVHAAIAGAFSDGDKLQERIDDLQA
ncbi:MAG: hypothetical protein KGL43_18925 [Burkholderiales bacterium]|nr:hypothetical protein [Burkholderiales bacterium]